MNTLRTDYNVRVLHGPNKEVSLEIKPGTWESDIVSRAVLAGMYQAVEDAHSLTDAQERNVRKAAVNLQWANHASHADRSGPVEPITFQPDVTDVVLDGLFALSMEAIAERNALAEKFPRPADRVPHESVEAQQARLAGLVRTELLDQGSGPGRAALDAAGVSTQTLSP